MQRVSPRPDLSYTKKVLFHTLVLQEAQTPPVGPGKRLEKEPCSGMGGGICGSARGWGKYPGLALVGGGTPNRHHPLSEPKQSELEWDRGSQDSNWDLQQRSQKRREASRG